jgi:hypothetical protein
MHKLSDGKTDGIDDLGRFEAIVQRDTAPCDQVYGFIWVDNFAHRSCVREIRV